MFKKVLSTIAITAAISFGAVANEEQFVKSNDDFITQSCYVAATEGIDAVKKLVESRFLSFKDFEKDVVCNGVTIDKFAKQHSAPAPTGQRVQLIATNNDLESRVCMAALTKDLDDVVKEFRINKEYIVCNRLSLTRFLEKNNDLIVANNTTR
ncbi:MAG: hypothetical protein AAGJ37_03155 [Pseudomonadota bacterium]